jgi:hypothetical protein
MDKEKVSPSEMIKILPLAKQLEAAQFIQLGEDLKCKAQTRYAHSNRYWRCTFSLRKPSRVLFALECTEDWWRIKAILSNMARYTDQLQTCSDELINIVKTAFDCRECNIRCKGAKPFIYEDIEYRKCIGCSYYFQDLSTESLENLKMLIKEDALALQA